MKEHSENVISPQIQQYIDPYRQPGQVYTGGDGVPANPGLGQPPGMAPGGPVMGPAPIQPTVVQPNVQPAAQQPAAQPAPGPDPLAQDRGYEFITNPPAPPKEPLLSKLPGSGSRATLIGLAGAAFLVFIIFLIIISNLSGRATKSNAVVLLTVLQDQQEIIHLTANTGGQAGLSTNRQNFIANLQLSVASSQAQLVSYMLAGHQKLTAKQLDLKIDHAADQKLAQAAVTGNYDSALKGVLESKLNAYGFDLQKAYKQDKGKNARAMISHDYDQIKLLATQLAQSGN